MELTTNHGVKKGAFTDAQIREALMSLNIDRDGEGFAIFARDEMTYVQAGGDSKAGFDLEYQDGGTDRHYRASRTDYSIDEIVSIFSQYRDGSLDWNSVGEWEQISW
jgi:hypothetical protein